MPLPKLLTAAETAQALGLTEDCLARWRADGTGPNWTKLNGTIRYPEHCIEAFINENLAQPTEAQKMRAAATHGLKEAGGAVRTRMSELAAADRQTTDPDNPYAVTVGDVGGSTPGIEKLTYQNGQWVKNGTLSQPVVESAAAPHLLNCR